MVRQGVVGGPDLPQAPAVDLEHAGPGAVLRRREDPVADHERRRGVDRGADARSPAPLEARPTGRRVEAQQRVAGEEDGVRHAAERRPDRRRVARLVARHGPEHVAGRGVEGDDAGVRPPDVRQHAAVLDERRAGGAEEPLAEPEARPGVDAPDAIAGLEVDGVERTLGPERVDAPPGDDRRGPRPLVEAEVVPVCRRVVVAPDRLPGAGIERLQHLGAALAVEEEQAVAGDDGPREALAHRAAPQLGGAPPLHSRARGGPS